MFHVIDYAVIVGIFAAIAFVGYWAMKNVKTVDDFLYSGRSVGKLQAGLTMTATEVGGGSVVGAIGLCYAMGYGGHYWMTSVVPPFLFAAFVVVKLFHKMGANSAPQYLGQRYSPKLRTLATVMQLCAGVAAMAGQFYVAASTVHLITGMNEMLAYVLVMLFVLFYTSAGGLMAVVKTDTLNCCIILTSVLAMLFFTIKGAGGWDAVKAAALPPEYFDPMNFDMWEMITWIVAGCYSYCANQNYIQRIHAAKDADTARFGFIFASGAFLVLAILYCFLGAAGQVAMPGIASEDQVYTTLALNFLPTGLKGLAIGGILAAVMSTADSSICAYTNLAINDLYIPYLEKKGSGLTQKESLKASRLMTIVLCVAGTFFGFFVTSIIDALYLVGLFYVSAVFFPLLLGMYWKKATALAAGSGMIVSVTVAMISKFYLYGNYGGLFVLPPNMIGPLCGLVVMVVISLLKPDKTSGEVVAE